MDIKKFELSLSDYPLAQGVKIRVETENTTKMYRWGMIVEVDKKEYSSTTSFYAGILVVDTPIGKICYATDYWSGVLPVEIPFIITEATPIE
jgi:hypothetical protein